MFKRFLLATAVLGLAGLPAAAQSVKISGLPHATTLTGAEVFPLNQNGTTVQASISQISPAVQNMLTLSAIAGQIADAQIGNNLLAIAQTNADLSALPSTSHSKVLRVGHDIVGDAPLQLFTLSSTPCTLNAGLGDGGIQVPTNDGGCANAVIAGPVDIRQWGAKVDGVTDDSAIFAKTSAAVGANLVHDFYVPGVSAITTGNLNFAYQNWHGLIGAGFKSLSATANMLNVGGPYTTLYNLTFTHGVARTAGADIALATTAARFTAEQLSFVDPFIGIQVLPSPGSIGNVHLLGSQFYWNLVPATGAEGIIVNGGTGTKVENTSSYGISSTQPTACIEVTNVQDISIIGGDMSQCGIPLLVDPSSSTQEVDSLRATNTFFDSSKQATVLKATNGGKIYRADFVQTWHSSSTNGCGIDMITSGGGIINGVDFVQSHVFGNSTGGICIEDSGTSNVHITGGEIAANSIGIFVATGGGNHLSILGSRIGPTAGFAANGQAWVIGSGNTNFLIKNNDVSGNTSAPTVLSPLTASEIVADNPGTANAGPVSGSTGTFSGAISSGGVVSAVGVATVGGVTSGGHYATGATNSLPTLASSAGTPTLATGSTDNGGNVRNTTANTSMTLTFGQTFLVAPFCTVTSRTAQAFSGYTVSTTQLVISYGSSVNANFDYICMGH